LLRNILLLHLFSIFSHFLSLYFGIFSNNIKYKPKKSGGKMFHKNLMFGLNAGELQQNRWVPLLEALPNFYSLNHPSPSYELWIQ
jgi:hypothetical protein